MFLGARRIVAARQQCQAASISSAMDFSHSPMARRCTSRGKRSDGRRRRLCCHHCCPRCRRHHCYYSPPAPGWSLWI